MKSIRILALLCLCAALAPAVRAADDEATQMQTIMQRFAPTIVTVRAVVKMQMKGPGAGGEGRDNESKMTMQGVVVDPTGLILVSSLPFSPMQALQAIGGADMPEGLDMKMTPTSINVTVPGETKEYDAFVAATDTSLGLTFIKIEDLAGKKLPAVDFTSATTPGIGDRVIAISRLKKGYDYAAFIQTARISGQIEKPRKAWMLDGNISGLGLPVFSPTGEMIGVLSMVASGVKDDSSGGDLSMLMRMFGGGGGASSLGTFVVPGAAVRPLIDQANHQAITVAAERAKKKAQQPAAPTPGK